MDNCPQGQDFTSMLPSPCVFIPAMLHVCFVGAPFLEELHLYSHFRFKTMVIIYCFVRRIGYCTINLSFNKRWSTLISTSIMSCWEAIPKDCCGRIDWSQTKFIVVFSWDMRRESLLMMVVELLSYMFVLPDIMFTLLTRTI